MMPLSDTMWLFVAFDLPATTKAEKGLAQRFRNLLLSRGFVMFQYSIYTRHCGKPSYANVIERFVEGIIPPGGDVAIIRLRDSQYGAIKFFYKPTTQKASKKRRREKVKQLTIF